jgi:hypothetical protein
MRLFAAIAGLFGLGLWLTAAPAVARSAAVDETVSADKSKHKHKHRDGGTEQEEESEEELQWQ